ncbi:mycothiol system anti-sigma-R factor [Carbonactinospora thermoautotrophica]|uniref:Anti-sigma factor n=1 Tax=Carbonactinospora thermoautotrophica TaxID=1469144 RepID=A0A132NB24_9ACTN|nr:mycothiol system anti-sigma-R factor [Carbonactinospora thermoautotrophica]KWW99377.1 putative anti-sigma factor [Carbonactinospora thermoautotrophica]KWX04171.1 anti-sigma factor [Carbonactinospora thermoautotrophica]KWX07308.1 anti-sigma factor [Carbonactinospora thermoautotrophica]MCX9192500.1 mycothiol system anti-sigma-R factor [Carbonactinospora thermoautotrophica]
MSCGKPHEIDCAEILRRVYEYLDNEMETADCEKWRQHLDECGPCLEKYGLEQVVKALVHRSCGCDPVPQRLRQKVLLRIAQVRAEISQRTLVE